MPLKSGAVIELARSGWPAFRRQRDFATRTNLWVRGRQFEIEESRHEHKLAPTHGGVYMPDGQAATTEYVDLGSRSQNNYAGLIVGSLAQTCFLDGVARPGMAKGEIMQVWNVWQQNGWDSRQTPVYKSAFGDGVSYTTALPGISPLTGERTSVWRGKSARRMAAFYDDESGDEFPLFSIEADTLEEDNGELVWQVKVYDEEATYYLEARNEGWDVKDWKAISYEVHGTGVTPVIRYANELDLDGRATGEIEPVIPLLRRIDQDVFDRLVVQRFGAWKIRYATGLAKPTTAEEHRAAEMLLKMGELLVSSDPHSKFGTLDPTEIKGFIEAHDVDLRDLAALTQMPPYHLLGLSSNLQAEALETARAGQKARSFERRTGFGESHESLFRVSAKQLGNLEEMRAFDMQVRWRPTDVLPLSQFADAAGKLATQVGVPQEMLFEMMPNWNDLDVQRALKLVESGATDALLDELSRQLGAGQPGPGQQELPVAAGV